MPVDLPSLAPPLPDLSRWERTRAVLDSFLIDHGFIRAVYWNCHRIAPGVWRGAQPSKRHLRWAKRQGIKTVVNLRGRRDDCGSYILEREACRELGLTLIDFPIRSRSPLDRPTILAAIKLFDDIEYPVLMHCKSGADRAGFMSTLYMFLKGGMPLRAAMKKHLSLAYGHLRQAKTGVIDFFFESYLAHEAKTRMPFAQWVETVYDRDKLRADFHESWLAGIIVDRILRRE
ncbi:MAG: fused DSP-PTPase phosphatase/NAD kinase-like protein [Gemmatimonas sp.]